MLRLLLLLIGFFLFSYCNTNPYTQGKIMYENFCANCHMEDGTGLEGNIPPLANADYLQTHGGKIACIIRYGIQETIVVNGKKYTTPMEGIPQLTEVEIANIINYINHAWGNKYGFVKIQEVKSQLERCE